MEAAFQKLCERLPMSLAALEAQQNPRDKTEHFSLLALIKTRAR